MFLICSKSKTRIDYLIFFNIKWREHCCLRKGKALPLTVSLARRAWV